MARNANLSITEGGIYLNVERQSGIKEQRPVALEDVAKIFNESMAYATPLMTGEDKVIAYSSRSNREMFITTSPPQIRSICYTEGDSLNYYNIPFPGAIFYTVLGKGSHSGGLQASCMYAHTGARLKSDSTLYKFPSANVYTDGKICWGEVHIKQEDITRLSVIFFGSRFNRDLDDNTIIAGQRGVVSFIQKLNDKEEFPEDKLLTHNMTLTDLYNKQY